MSLFKARDFWSSNCTDEEQFDQNSLKLSRLNSHFEYILLGSHSGILKIFSPAIEISGYNPTDLVLEKTFDNPILQLETGRLVSGSLHTQIAILFPRCVSIFSLKSKEGAIQHGNQNMLQLMYEHKLKRSAANFTIGPFGGTQNRDFLCVQSLDGLLTFFEQESFVFCCFLPNFLLPGPLVYVKKTDSFITAGSNWYIESYKYKYLSEASQNSDQNDNTGKKVEYSWNFNLSEPILDINVLNDYNTGCILVLGEKNLYCITENGRLKFMKRLDYSPMCFTSYVLDEDKIMSVVVSEASTLLIYQNTTLKWSAKLSFLPVTIRRGFLENISGALIMLSEEGFLQCCYLGTDPNLFTAPPLTNQELDFEKADSELQTLNKIIQNSYSNDVTVTNTTIEHELSITVNINPHLKPCTFTKKFAGTNDMCEVTIDILPKAPFEEIQISIFVLYPLIVEPSTIFFNSFKERTMFICHVFADDGLDVPSMELEVIASCISNIGIPKTIVKKVLLPMNLIFETSQALKENQNKIVFNINQSPIPLSTLFPEFMGENSLNLNTNAIGFKNKMDETINVSILVAKSSERYRLQSESLTSLNFFVEQLIQRLKKEFTNNSEFAITFTSSLPIQQIIEYISKHFESRQNFNQLLENLTQLGAQFRLIQKRLISKFKLKNPAPLTNLELLLQDTYDEVIDCIKKLEEENMNLLKTQIELSCALNLIINLVKLMDVNNEVLILIKSAFTPSVYDMEGQNWEDTMDASLCYLLRTVLAKSEKDKLRAPHTSFEEIKDISKLEKHITHVLERVSKKGPILETHFNTEDETVKEIDGGIIEKEKKLVPIGSQIAEASSRILSARKSLLRKRHKQQEEN